MQDTKDKPIATERFVNMALAEIRDLHAENVRLRAGLVAVLPSVASETAVRIIREALGDEK